MSGVSRKEVQDLIEETDRLILEKGNSKKAIKNLEDTLQKLEPSSEEYYEVLIKLSKTYRDNKSFNLAEDLLYRAVAEAKKFDKEIYLADIYRSIAFIKLQKQNFAAARKYAKKALAIVKYMKGFKAKRTKADIYAALGNIYFTASKYEDALENYKKALKKSQDIDFQRRIISVKSDIANVYIETDKLDEAKNLLLLIKKQAEKEYEIGIPRILLRLARIEHIQNNNDRAQAYAQEALSYASSKGWKRFVADAREGLAYIYHKAGKGGKKKAEVKKASKIYRDIGLEKRAEKVKKKI
jgi:tetratricopeptide (TPR) repeat protein